MTTDAEPRITNANYQPTLAMLWAQANMIAEAPLAEMIAAAERARTLGPFLDPTAYIAQGQALNEDIAMLDALRGVQVALERMRRRKAGA